MGTKTKLVLASIATAATVGTGAYTLSSNQATQQPKTAEVETRTLFQKLTLSGEIQAEETVTLRFQTAGRLAWVGVKQGDRVKKYQVLATLDQRELKKKLQKDLNVFKNERWDLDQSRDDYEGVAITEKFQRIMDKAQFDLDNAIIDVQIQDLTLQLSRLSTPIEGIVTHIDKPYAGVNITPAGAEFEVVNPQTAYFEATADQTEVILLSEGMGGTLVLDSYLDEEVSGQIKNISFTPKSGETGTVYAIKFILTTDNSSYQYRLGMTGDLTFRTSEKRNALTIPTSFVQSEGSKNFVYLEKSSGKVEKREIKTSLESDGYIEVVSGLKESDTLYDKAPGRLQGIFVRKK